MTNDWAIVVLPEIFGVNGFVSGVVDRLGKTHKVPACAVDFFFPVTGQHKVYDYVADREEAHHAMTEVSSEVFLEYFTSELDRMQTEHPSVTKFAVVGFCFGGNLAYLAGTDPRVQKIISFYGTRAEPAVRALAAARATNPPSVLSFYGGTDTSIPESDRALTKKLLSDAHIPYQEVVYPDAGHAFMNHERPDRYHEASANDSIARVDAFLVA
jgi:carboxymethylenebutenolidase